MDLAAPLSEITSAYASVSQRATGAEASLVAAEQRIAELQAVLTEALARLAAVDAVTRRLGELPQMRPAAELQRLLAPSPAPSSSPRSSAAAVAASPPAQLGTLSPLRGATRGGLGSDAAALIEQIDAAVDDLGSERAAAAVQPRLPGGAPAISDLSALFAYARGELPVEKFASLLEWVKSVNDGGKWDEERAASLLLPQHRAVHEAATLLLGDS